MEFINQKITPKKLLNSKNMNAMQKVTKNQIRVQRFRDKQVNLKNDEFKFFVYFHEHLNFFDQFFNAKSNLARKPPQLSRTI